MKETLTLIVYTAHSIALKIIDITSINMIFNGFGKVSLSDMIIEKARLVKVALKLQRMTTSKSTRLHNLNLGEIKKKKKIIIFINQKSHHNNAEY